MIKKYTIILIAGLVLGACSSAKKAEKSIETGDYDKAFNIAVTDLTKDKHKKSNQKLVPTLKEAYDKANERDAKKIKEYKKLNDPTYYKQIYSLYMAMDVRQDEVLTLQPLYYEDKEIGFKTKNYTQDINKALENYSYYLFNLGTQQLSGSKLDARNAYQSFSDLEFVNPSYKPNLGDLVRQAKLKGSSHVLINLQNNIQNHTSVAHIEELMRIDAESMNNPWVIYYKDDNQNITFDYDVTMKLDQINLTPEQVNTEIIQQQARVKDGWEYVYDGNGNVMKDSLGNDIKRDKIITVQAEVKMFQQLKTSRVDGGIKIRNLSNNTSSETVPLFGEAVFENVFALYQGDQRAIEEKYYEALKNKEVPFPADSDFVKYALAEFRIKTLQLLDDQPF